VLAHVFAETAGTTETLSVIERTYDNPTLKDRWLQVDSHVEAHEQLISFRLLWIVRCSSHRLMLPLVVVQAMGFISKSGAVRFNTRCLNPFGRQLPCSLFASRACGTKQG
jgi:hypothetical protein